MEPTVTRTRTRKTPRKSRGKGLRTKTGCITCRQRHRKCNEAFPVCGNCGVNRTCVWPNQVQPNNDNTAALQTITTPSNANLNVPEFPIDEPASNPSNAPTIASEFLTADLASIRWLDLLAEDALQANRGFTRPSSPTPFEPEIFTTPNDDRNGHELHPMDRHSWSSSRDIELKDSEILIFRHFVDHAALWLDLFDSNKHFSVYITRLSLRNIGLMKAILALSAQHLSRRNGQDYRDSTINDPNIAIQYYYETLHYVQTALQYNSYAHSEELLATALIISTYEMLNESQSEWQRHLKGVFWIQRSQNVNGASGGIQQAVWWAWLRQDAWAAFRERRRCFSFWKPAIDYPGLSKSEHIDRIIYLFSQVVNFCADTTDISRIESAQEKKEMADNLLAMLDRWRSFLSEEFKTLPVPKTGTLFQPIWIHPPALGVALQIFYFARILIILHRPAMSGYNSHMKVQKSLSEAVAIIAGIAMQLSDEGCQIISAQCLFGAGLCVQETSKRNEIISLITACEARTSWPMSTLYNGLYEEWKKIDSTDGKELSIPL